MLNDSQIRNLSVFVRDWATRLSIGSQEFQKAEEKFTAEYLLPLFTQEINNLLKPALIVRGDGGSPMKQVVWSGLTFYPDLSICEHDARYVAIEVKILKDKQRGGGDPGGALSKAIGQTTLYSILGYAYSLGLVFDLRSSRGQSELVWRENLVLSENAEIHIYS